VTGDSIPGISDLDRAGRDIAAAPILATAPATRRDRAAALAVIIVSLIGLAIILPLGDTPWPRMVAFIPADDTGLALIDMITAMLLIGQFTQLRTPSLLPLACGYMFACFIVIAHLLSYAEALRALRPDMANPQTTAWLAILWHGVFPLFILAYAFLVDGPADRPAPLRALTWLIAATIAIALGGAVLSVWIITAVWPSLPILVSSAGSGSLAIRDASLAAGLVGVTCLTALYLRTRARRVLDLWLCVVLFALVLDILVGGALTSRTAFSFGGYAARIYGLLAASLVLSALLLETGQLYASLIRVLAEKRAQSVELDRSEAALRQAQKMETIGQITGGVAHDFNNLLTVVIGSLDQIRRHPDDVARTVRRAGLALEAANRGAQLTKQLLTFSRRQAIRPEVIDPNRLIREFDPLLRQAVGGSVDIRLDLAAETAPVRVDPAQFQTAILNLAVNARDAMDGAGNLTITTSVVSLDRSYADLHPEAAPGNYLMVAVADTGCGMDQETVAQAFEPFFTTKEVGKGSGLGLSQVYGFAKSADGHVHIRSALGEGTVVELYLPRSQVAFMPVAPQAKDSVIRPSASGETILVVEDDAGVRDTTAESLIELGYEVIAVADPAAALDHLRNGAKIDIVFSDVVMPGGMNGAELAAAIRLLRPGQPILLTSGYSSAVLNQTHDMPCDIEIIAKPYRHEDLARKLRRLLDAVATVTGR